MKFAHLADAHIGGFREPKLRELGVNAFIQAVDRCIAEKVDFVLIAGDLFNTSVPAIECMKSAVHALKKLKNTGIPVYMVAGSHDFSPSGKTMLEVLEEAELIKNVCIGTVVDRKLRLKFTVDPGTGAKITGMIGKRGMLERNYYEELDKSIIEQEEGFKIFMFHTAIEELKPTELEKMEAAPISLLPKGFDYYAGGHVHIVKEGNLEGYRNVIYPGPVFPNSFSELDKLGSGSFYLYSDGNVSKVSLPQKKTVKIDIDCKHKTPDQVSGDIASRIDQTIIDAIVLLRLHGTLESGKISDIRLGALTETMYEKGAYFVMRNTAKLSTRDFSEVKVVAETADETERLLIEEHIGQSDVLSLGAEREKRLVNDLMITLDLSKDEGEKQHDYEERVIAGMKKIIGNL